MNNFDYLSYLKNNPLLKENTQSKYEFGCVMLYFNFPELNKIQDAINPDDIYEEDGDKKYGLEDEPHCTLLYGLHPEVTLDQVKEVVSKHKFGPKPLTIHNVSIFKNDKYDVLKFDVKGEILHEINGDLKQFPYTSDYPDYHPHLTIGYLKPGMGEKYVKQFKDIEFELKPENVVYSQPNGEKNKIEIEMMNEIKVNNPSYSINKNDLEAAIKFEKDGINDDDSNLKDHILVTSNRMILNNISNRLNLKFPLEYRTTLAYKLMKRGINLKDKEWWNKKTDDFGNGTGWEQNSKLNNLVINLSKIKI